MNTLLKKTSVASLAAFQKQYPQTTSGDLQAFTLGYKAAVEDVQKLLTIIVQKFDRCVHGDRGCYFADVVSDLKLFTKE
jgi:hypothetical protein